MLKLSRLKVISIVFTFLLFITGTLLTNVSFTYSNDVKQVKENSKDTNENSLIEKLKKISLIFENIYNKKTSKYENTFYYYGLIGLDNVVKETFEKYDKLFKTVKNNYDNISKKKIMKVIIKLNELAYNKKKQKVIKKLLDLKNKSYFQLECAYALIKNNDYENKYKNAKYKGKQEILKQLKGNLYEICGKIESSKYQLDNDKKLIKNDILDNFNDIKIIPSKNISLYKQEDIYNKKLDVSQNPLLVKIPSLVGHRNLVGHFDYHGGIDITMSNLSSDMKYNYQFISGQKKSKNITNDIKKLWIVLFSDIYNELLLNKGTGYSNYKTGNKLYINITNNFLDKYNCYLGINRSRYSRKVVGFGYFLLCEEKKKRHAIVIGHLSPENYSYLKNVGLLQKINDGKERFRLGLLTGKGYEENYYGFNKNKQSWDYPYQETYYGIPNSNNLYYKIKKNNNVESGINGILLKYGTTGHSYGEHIHMSNIILDGNVSSIITDNTYLNKVVQKMFGTDKINFTKNHFFFLSSL